MHNIADGYRGLSLIVTSNTDRLLFPALIFGALGVTAWLVPLLTTG